MANAGESHPPASPPGRLTTWLALALAVGLGLRLVFMAVSVIEAPVTSDEAMVVLQAKAVTRGERPIFFPAQPYQFPLASYLIAPLVSLMPRNAIGVRWFPFAMGLGSFLLLLNAMRRFGPWSRIWPAALLVAFPSCYLLTFQAGYSVPSYDVMLALWALTLWLALAQRERQGWRGAFMAAAAGLASGMAFSVHPLSLSLVIPLGLFVCLDRGWRPAMAKTPAFGLGLLLGILPFLLGDILYPGASTNVTGRRPLPSVLNLDFVSVAGHALSGALGFFLSAFPDFGQEIHWWSPAERVLLGLFALALAASTLISLYLTLARSWRNRWPSLEADDVFPLACWLGLAMFAINERSNSSQFRYLLVAAWSLPFLAAGLLRRAQGWKGRTLVWAAMVLVAFNLTASATLIWRWSQPGYVAAQALSPDLTPVIRTLEKEGVGFCYASHWTAYRVTFLTDERIICEQPFNERFRDWPLPNKDKVDRADRAAYLLTTPDSFNATAFEQALEQGGVRAREIKIGAHHLYLDFVRRPELRVTRAPSTGLTFSASHGSERAARLGGHLPGRGWNSGAPQEEGMWLEIALERALPLNRLVLRYPDRDPYPLPRAYRLWARENGVWRVALPQVRAGLDDFEMVNQHPVWDRPVQTLDFPPTVVDALRLEVMRKGNPVPWSLDGVEVYTQLVAD